MAFVNVAARLAGESVLGEPILGFFGSQFEKVDPNSRK